MTVQLDRSLIPSAVRRALAGRLHGNLVTAEDERYESARAVWNAAIDARPAAVVEAADPADVIRVVNVAADHGLRLAVRSGGHGLAGHGTGDDALVVDLGRLRNLTIDPERRLAWAGPGLTAGEYTERAHEHGLATPFGDAASVGLGGLTVGGGVGYLSRRHGLTIDNLVSAEVVTADGRLVVASEEDDPDLFWAIRGGGGNFGVVTGFQYRLHTAGLVYGGGLLQPATRNVLRGFGPLAASATEDLTMIGTVMAAPPAPFVPADRVGELSLAMLGVHLGIPGGEEALAPFRALATPIADTFGPMPYPVIYEYTREATRRQPGAHRSLFVETLDDAVVDTILEFMGRATSPAAMTQIRVLGGAVSRVADSATAYAHRNAGVMIVIITPFMGPAPAEAHVEWTRAFHEALRPRSTGVYVNFLEDEGEARIREAYPAPTYARLGELKRRYDPTNLFRLNQNIAPA